MVLNLPQLTKENFRIKLKLPVVIFTTDNDAFFQSLKIYIITIPGDLLLVHLTFSWFASAYERDWLTENRRSNEYRFL